MEIRANVTKEEVVGVICDVCKEECQNREYAKYKGVWGYWSKRDLTVTESHLCEGCAEKVEEFIRSIGGTVRDYGYGPPGHEPLEGRDWIMGEPTKYDI